MITEAIDTKMVSGEDVSIDKLMATSDYNPSCGTKSSHETSDWIRVDRENKMVS